MKQSYQYKDQITIGRRDCDITICDHYISLHHCLIEQGQLIDLDSLNGTYLNQQKIKKANIQPGDYLTLPHLSILFLKNCMIIKKDKYVQINLAYYDPPQLIEPELCSLLKPTLTINLEVPPRLIEKSHRPILFTIGPSLTMSLIMMITSYLSHSVTTFYISLAMAISMSLFPLLGNIYENRKAGKENKKRKEAYYLYLESIRKQIDAYSKQLIDYYHYDHHDFHVGIGNCEMQIDFKLPHMEFQKSELEMELLSLVDEKRIIEQVPIQQDLSLFHSIYVTGKYKEEYINYLFALCNQKQIQLIIPDSRLYQYFPQYEKKLYIQEQESEFTIHADSLFFPIIEENDLLRKLPMNHTTYNILDYYNVLTIDKIPLTHYLCNEHISCCIGFDESGKEIILDLHENQQGPHGLLAGMTGSGKSELLITLIIMLSLRYDSQYLSFLLIDFKGGSLTEVFQNHLPHLANSLSNLDSFELMRGIYGLKHELKRRQELFQKVKKDFHLTKMDIDLYQSNFAKGAFKEPLSHLVIIVDEFAELKNSHIEMIDELIHIARIGRSLGFHLLLTTQKPSGVVNGQIWSNTNYHICMKVQDSADSLEMIHSKEGAYLQGCGDFYLQSKQEIIKGKALYLGDFYSPREMIEITKKKTNQYDHEVLLEHIQKHHHCQARSIWLPSLTQKLSLDQLPENCVGFIDDYYHVCYHKITIEKNSSHILIVGKEGKCFLDAVMKKCSDLHVVYLENGTKEDLIMYEKEDGIILLENLSSLMIHEEYALLHFLQESKSTVIGLVDSIMDLKYHFQKYFLKQYIFDIEGYNKSMNLRVQLKNERNKGIVFEENYIPLRIGE